MAERNNWKLSLNQINLSAVAFMLIVISGIGNMFSVNPQPRKGQTASDPVDLRESALVINSEALIKAGMSPMDHNVKMGKLINSPGDQGRLSYSEDTLAQESPDASNSDQQSVKEELSVSMYARIILNGLLPIRGC